MSSPPPAMPPGSNVTPMWGGSWPGRPPAVPPNCFSQLYGLNQCYDDIIMMQQILMKVICDMAANNPAFQKCLAEGIAAAGSSVPILGVTNGSDAQPGQVGEWIQTATQITIPTTGTTPVIVPVTLQPGDWDTQAAVYTAVFTNDVQILVPTPPTGVQNSYLSSIGATAGALAVELFSAIVRVSISVPTLIPFQLTFNSLAAGPAGNGIFEFTARRMR